MAPSTTTMEQLLLTLPQGKALGVAHAAVALDVSRDAAAVAMQEFCFQHEALWELHFTVAGIARESGGNSCKVFRRVRGREGADSVASTLEHPSVELYAIARAGIDGSKKACVVIREDAVAGIRPAAGAPASRPYPTLSREATIKSALTTPTRSLSDLIRQTSGPLAMPPPLVASAPAQSPLVKTPLAVASSTGGAPATKHKPSFVSAVPESQPAAVTATATTTAAHVASPQRSSAAASNALHVVVDDSDTCEVAEAPAVKAARIPQHSAPQQQQQQQPPGAPVVSEAEAPPVLAAPAPVAVAAAAASAKKQVKPTDTKQQRTLTEMFLSKRKRETTDGAADELQRAAALLSDHAANADMKKKATASSSNITGPKAAGNSSKQQKRKKAGPAAPPLAKGSLKGLVMKGAAGPVNTALLDDDEADRSCSDSEDEDAKRAKALEKHERARYEEQFETGELQLVANDDIVIEDRPWQGAAGEQRAEAEGHSGRRRAGSSSNGSTADAATATVTAKRARENPRSDAYVLPPSQPRITSFLNSELLAFQKLWTRVVVTESVREGGEYVCRDVEMYKNLNTGEQVTPDEYRLRANRIKAASDATAALSAARGRTESNPAPPGAPEKGDELPEKKGKKGPHDSVSTAVASAAAKPAMAQMRLTAFFAKK